MKLISAVFITYIPLLSGNFVILLRLWAPKARHCHIPPVTLSLSLFFFFFPLSSLLFFLSFSLLLYLFFFVFFFGAKSSYSPTTHTGHSHAGHSHADHSHADPSREIIGINLRSHVEKLHHALVLLIVAIVLVLRSGRSIEIGIHSNDGSYLETIRSGSSFFDLEALLSALGTAPLEACFLFGSYLFIYFFRGVS